MNGQVGGGLSAFFAPGSVAVVGASNNPAKWGYYLAHGALAGARFRPVYLVNVRTEPVAGNRVHATLADLSSPPELVVVAVPGPAVAAVVADGLALGSRAFIVVAADVPDPAALVRRVTAAGGRILGPNCLGVFDAASHVRLAAWMDLVPGPMAVVTQSGQVGRDISAIAGPLGLGISRFVSLGPQLDVAAHEVLEELVSHEPTLLVALYLEGFGAGRALVETITRLRAAGKPTILMTAGRSPAGQRAALSHTGALTAPTEVVAAACRAAGAVRVSTPAQLVSAARVLLQPRRPAGGRVAIFGDSGGQGAVAADLALELGLEVPGFPEGVGAAVESAVTALVPHMRGTANPVDLANAGDRDMFIYSDLAAIAFDGDAADAVLITGYFGQYGHDAAELLPQELAVVARLATVSARTGKPIIVNTPATDSPVLPALEQAGITVFHTVEAGLGALATAAAYAAGAPRTVTAPHGVAAPRTMAAPEVAAVVRSSGPDSGYLAARRLAQAYGISFPQAQGVASPADLASAAAQLRAPYALKAGWLTHKSEQKAVVVGIRSAAALELAYAEMSARLGAGVYVVEEMDCRDGVVELIIGARRDPNFGPIILVGAGGVLAELYQDVTTELAPVSRECARAMLARLRCAPMMTGWRGAAPLDTEAVIDVIVAVSDLVTQDGEVQDIELNPVRVAAAGAIAVDALITRPRAGTARTGDTENNGETPFPQEETRG